MCINISEQKPKDSRIIETMKRSLNTQEKMKKQGKKAF